MIKEKLHNYISKIINKSLDHIKFQNGCSHFALARKNYKYIKNIDETDFKVYSQNGEDGILDYLLSCLSIKKPKFVEIGVGDYSESNTRFIFERTSCQGLIIDNISNLEAKVKKNIKIWKGNLKIVNASIDTNNITSVLNEYNFLKDLDLFSLDIDGIDYWILKKLPAKFCKIAVAEFNPYFGSKSKITVPNLENFKREKYHYSNLCFGASLSAMIDLFKEKKFTFIGTNLFRNNAFFVNSDYLNNLNTLDLESEKNLDKFVNANFRESRDRKNNLNLISPDKILEVIKDCEVIDVSNNLMEKRKISEF